mgnify:CR=1 FL=1
MSKRFLPEITYMRGLCMLGVIAIHVGSLAIANPLANVQLIGFLEILSRFAVPAFFFLSAFGLFYHTSVDDAFSYKNFLKKRIQVVFWPYVMWTLLYTLHGAISSHNWGGFHPGPLAVNLLFGNGMYHLYFLVILLWFYVLMPLWRSLVRFILKAPIVWLAVLFFLQVGVDFISSYRLGAWVSAHFGQQPVIKYFFDMRLNYWVVHYVWIFALGAVFAEKYDQVMAALWRYRVALATSFIGSVALMLGAYYYVLGEWHYTLLEAIYTVHQLSPMGVLYTGVGPVFFTFLFAQSPMSRGIQDFWQQIGDTSYGIYLVHPFWLIILSGMMARLHMLMTVPHVIGLYCMAVAVSYLSTLALQQLPKVVRQYLLGH